MSLFILYMVFLGKLSCFFQCLNLIPVNTCIFLNGIYHCNSFKWFAKIHFHTIVCDSCSSENFLCHMAIQVLCQIHHSVIICVRLIKLHQRKFRIMSCVQSFITEHTSNLVYFLNTADNQSLKIQFQRNTKFKVFT